MGLRRSFKPTNLIANGNFANGTTGWDGGANATISASNNVLSVTGNGTTAYIVGKQTTSIAVAPGNKMYVKGLARVTNSGCPNMYLEIDGSTGGDERSIARSNPVQNQWYPLSNVLTQAADFTGNLVLKPWHTYADAATANGKVMEIKEVITIDLTALFGAGKEPNKAWCDTNIHAAWFDGTANSGSMGKGGLR